MRWLIASQNMFVLQVSLSKYDTERDIWPNLLNATVFLFTLKIFPVTLCRYNCFDKTLFQGIVLQALRSLKRQKICNCGSAPTRVNNCRANFQLLTQTKAVFPAPLHSWTLLFFFF